jgi:glycosyltransferase involved in cell wall biosynthesis
MTLGMSREQIWSGYNVVDNMHFADQPPEQTPLELKHFQTPYFLVMSRLVREKNVNRIMEAYQIYVERTQRAPWPLVICGEGPERRSLERVVFQKNLGELVIFLGFRRYEELPTIYQRAGALVHLSVVEPWGLVVNEAMAAGLPVIVSSRCGCCAELIRHGVNGYIVDPLDVRSVASILADFAEERVDRRGLGVAGREIVAALGPERFGSSFGSAFRSAAHGEYRAKVGSDFRIGMLARFAAYWA